jgi:hypothetical protein
MATVSEHYGKADLLTTGGAASFLEKHLPQAQAIDHPVLLGLAYASANALGVA